MGGLFSSNEPPRAQPRQTYYEPAKPVFASHPRQYRVAAPEPERPRQTYYHQDRGLLFGQNYHEPSPARPVIASHLPEYRVAAPEPSVRNPRLFNMADSYFNTEIYTLIQLSQYDLEYRTITSMITNKRNFKVDNIQRIENPYLQTAYELKKNQKETRFFPVEEVLLFHGTKRINVDAICKKNFNWRLCKEHKFGKGISFSPNATYASNYSDEYIQQKVMFVAKVLIGRSCPGNKFMELPPDGFDTTQKGEDRIVIVKYEDNEFCPVYNSILLT